MTNTVVQSKIVRGCYCKLSMNLWLFGAQVAWGVHIAPRGDSHDMGDENPLATFGYVMQQLSQRKIAFVFSREYQAEDSIGAQLRAQFSGAWIANEGLTAESGQSAIGQWRCRCGVIW